MSCPSTKTHLKTQNGSCKKTQLAIPDPLSLATGHDSLLNITTGREGASLGNLLDFWIAECWN